MLGPKSKRAGARTKRFAYEGLDRAIHERARLGVLTCLLAHPDGLSFPAIKALCGLTDGNLSRHLEVLESAKLVHITKAVEGNRLQTSCCITPAGRKRFLAYLAVLEQVLLDANHRGETEPGSRGLTKLQET
ncbi:MAG TPA: transcriptional regulator [Steroidobacteraceae bacterium]|nr:transcriptional regulator [Steroidobacteraceae bacterium]